MTEIPEVVEGINVVIPDYTEKEFSDADIARGLHRNFVSGKGGQWDRDGLGQLTFLNQHGLTPGSRFVDVGCGALRAGRHLIDFLDAGNYYGVDANRSLLQIGYDRELTDEQRSKLPVANLRANDRFNVDFGVKFDLAIAQSVFTHVSLNHMRLCLYRLAKVMRPGGVFYASFVEQPLTVPVDYTYEAPKGTGRTFLNEKNVFWYHRRDLRWAASFGPWKFSFVGDYKSPQGQKMVAYTRLTDDEVAARDGEAAQARARARATKEALDAGGVRTVVFRARRRAASIISPL